MGENEVTIWEKLENVDRRIIYLLLWIVVLAPLISPLNLPVSISEETKIAYQYIENLPPGSVVVVSLDHSFAGMPELYPHDVAFLHHLFSKPVKIVIIAIWQEGSLVADVALKELAGGEDPRTGIEKIYGKKYGEDWVFLGWVPGGETGMRVLGQDMHTAVPADFWGTPITEFPMMADIKTGEDVDLLVTIESGTPGAPEWIRQWWSVYRTPIICAIVAVGAPELVPARQAGQLVALLPGVRAAAEYEQLIKRPGLGTSQADALSTSHILVIIFVIIGNIGYFSLKAKGVRK
ncbi:MAG: hypothetical protein NDF55_08390 [archaeon GB-1867-005]|nr:hypothetical protein [Candidatus Culexmicrobium cathedralense]